MPAYGQKASQFVDLLGYFTISTPQVLEKVCVCVCVCVCVNLAVKVPVGMFLCISTGVPTADSSRSVFNILSGSQMIAVPGRTLVH